MARNLLREVENSKQKEQLYRRDYENKAKRLKEINSVTASLNSIKNIDEMILIERLKNVRLKKVTN